MLLALPGFSWPLAFTLCPTHCRPVNVILPDPRTLDECNPSSKLVSHLYTMRHSPGT